MCKLKSYKEFKERILRMKIVKHDSVDISPSDFQPETQTAETQVRPKSRAESRSSALQPVNVGQEPESR